MACYVVSVGDYDRDSKSLDLKDGIDVLLKEQKSTLLVIPDAVSLSSREECKNVQQHCGYAMKNCFAILDIHEGFKEAQDSGCIVNFRSDVGTSTLDFAAAYYPWLNTSIVQTTRLSFANVSNVDKLRELLKAEVDASELKVQKKTKSMPRLQKSKYCQRHKRCRGTWICTSY